VKKKILFSLVIFIFLTHWIYGYLDPGTGSFIIQVLLAVGVTVSLAVKMSWKKVKTFFGNLFSKKSKEDPGTADHPPK
jgi:predicted membrane protein